MNPDQEYVLKTIETRDVHFVRFWFTDLVGRMKSFAVSPSELADAFEEGIGFDGGYIEGFDDGQGGYLLAYPEAPSFQVLPWRPVDNAVARMFCTIRTPEGEVFDGDPRQVLTRTVSRLSEAGYEPILGPEVEYFYFSDASSAPGELPQLLDRGGYFDLTSLDSASDLRRDTVLTLEKMGIPVEYSHHERGPSQHEVDLRVGDALAMADAVMTYKMVVKEVALAHDVYASFMPKPRTDVPGSGLHLHLSLFDAQGNNAFYDETDSTDLGLSETAKHFVAGLLHYAPEYTLLMNQFANSYKRLAQDVAPHMVAWSRTSRNAMVRIPGYKPLKHGASRIELRSPDPACNPYLAFAAALSAGFEGIKQSMDLDAFPKMEAGEQIPEGTRSLPENLGQAIEAFESSELMRQVLGERMHARLVQLKREEWHESLAAVTDWDLARYFEVL